MVFPLRLNNGINLAFYKTFGTDFTDSTDAFFPPAEEPQGKKSSSRRRPEGKGLATLPIPFITQPCLSVKSVPRKISFDKFSNT